MRSGAGARGRVAVLAVVAAVLAGCSGGSGAPAETSSSGGTGSPERAGRLLSTGEARKALLRAPDLPSEKWNGALAPTGKAAVRTDPPGCAELLTALTGPEHHAQVAMNFATTSGGMSLEETITSFKENAAPLLERLPGVLSGCSTFTRPDAKGTTSTFTAEPMSFPSLGERTFAVRFTVTTRGTGSDELKIYADTVYVAVGHNGVAFVAGGLERLPADQLESVVRAGMARLAA